MKKIAQFSKAKWAYVLGSLFLGGAWLVENTRLKKYNDFEAEFLRKYADYRSQEQSYVQAYFEETNVGLLEWYHAQLTRDSSFMNNDFLSNKRFHSIFSCSQAIINFVDAQFDLGANVEHDRNDTLAAERLDTLYDIRSNRSQHQLASYHKYLATLIDTNQIKTQKSAWLAYYDNEKEKVQSRVFSIVLAIVGAFLLFANSYHDFHRQKEEEARVKKIDVSDTSQETLAELIYQKILANHAHSLTVSEVGLTNSSEKSIAKRVFQLLKDEIQNKNGDK